MTDEERLLEFLYVAPVGLIEFDDEGNVKMANPRIAQLFNRFAPGGYFANIFNFLDDVLPELKERIVNFTDANGQIMENARFKIQAPDGKDDETLWIDVTVMRQEEKRYIASVNNVTQQVQIENEKFLVEEQLRKIFEVITKHTMFTLNSDGVIDSWNRTGEIYLTHSEFAVGKVLSQVIPIDNEKLAHHLSNAANEGISKDQIQITDKMGVRRNAAVCLSAINDLDNSNRGYSVVLSME